MPGTAAEGAERASTAGGGGADSAAGGSNYISRGAFDGLSDSGTNFGQGYVTVTYGTADFPSFARQPARQQARASLLLPVPEHQMARPQYFTPTRARRRPA